jgi:hypothetical protein
VDGDLGDREPLLADQRVEALLEVRAAVQPLDERRPDERQHRERGRGGGKELDRESEPGEVHGHPGECTGRNHEEDQVEAEQLQHTEEHGQREPRPPEVFCHPVPVHDPSLRRRPD